MERYVKQLIEDLRFAQKPENFDNAKELDGFTTMALLTGIDTIAFPPVEKLSDIQLQKLSQEMIALVESYNYIINLPKRLPAGIVYQKLLSKWNEKIPYIYHGLSAEWEFYR